ncbi:MAG: hypothetical protein AAGI01_11425, partial [Myxococcota bacterium]
HLSVQVSPSSTEKFTTQDAEVSEGVVCIPEFSQGRFTGFRMSLRAFGVECDKVYETEQRPTAIVDNLALVHSDDCDIAQ